MLYVTSFFFLCTCSRWRRKVLPTVFHIQSGNFILFNILEYLRASMSIRPHDSILSIAEDAHRRELHRIVVVWSTWKPAGTDVCTWPYLLKLLVCHPELSMLNVTSFFLCTSSRWRRKVLSNVFNIQGGNPTVLGDGTRYKHLGVPTGFHDDQTITNRFYQSRRTNKRPTRPCSLLVKNGNHLMFVA